MESQSYRTIIGISVVITMVLTALVFVHYRQISKRPGTIVLPAGGTYLGPSATPTPSQTPPPESTVFTVPDNTPWRTLHGILYPYTFDAPTTLELTTFPHDPYDMYAIVWRDITPSSNVLIGLDHLTGTKRAGYIDQPKIIYVRDWWKQFGGLTGVTSVESFENAHHLKGYRAKYTNAQGKPPNTDVFFEIPAHPEYVIHLASGILDKPVFDAIVDSVNWAAK